ncbi:antitoxin RelF [Nocardioides baekrokdamisoli]|uniref:Antitoxin n=1 Tax=Nocardioides baekrokdamisoli TaxID=1804624 RepID=A0A3G9IBR7_9ACTN|nr:type II toxin-antitoxin system Phd/YefM family antitoxin [Nocardioides baekrokdamisoli]BBH15716.1 antitoxin RelF [Nocardioides baekrokdamisoli]
MQTIPLSDFKAHLSENVERAQVEHEQFTITRNGRPAVVMISADEWESIQETLFWRRQAGILDDIAEADAEYASGGGLEETELRAHLGLRSRG